MPNPASRTFGFELEYASHTSDMVDLLYALGVTHANELHSYHCDCEYCSFTGSHDRWDPDSREYITVGPADLRAQRDSTVDGEFISRVLDDWDDLRSIVGHLTAAATTVAATTTSRCGLHVHVAARMPSDDDNARLTTVPATYLAFERYFTEIVAPGASERKRDMNSTLMQAFRQYVSDSWGGGPQWMDLSRSTVDDLLRAVIARDRHVDLNWSRRHSTWEFRVFNATNSPWRIELACRMAVAFIQATPDLRDAVESVVRGSQFWPKGCDSVWGEIARPAYSELPTTHPTKKPVVPMADFVNILCEHDPALRPLIDRQANYMRTRYARQVEVAA
jgi:hypothetical protein